MTAAELPELATADHAHVRACTAGGVDHDYRTYRKADVYPATVRVLPVVANPSAPTAAEVAAAQPIAGSVVTNQRTYLRCVWCHAVTCGDADETDPCIEPQHHRVPHRTRLGVTWPKGGSRPQAVAR